MKQFAGQYERKGIGRTVVAVHPGAVDVVGFFTLSAASLEAERLPPDLRKKLPRHPIPVVLLGRLAVDQSEQGKGLGKVLTTAALRRALAVADHVGVYGVQVSAIDDAAGRFYQRFGFRLLTGQDDQLIIPAATVRKSLDG